MTQETKNYVAAWFDWDIDKIVVLERDAEGRMYRKKYNPPYYFYVPHEDGQYTSIFGDRLMRAEFSSRDEYNAAKNQYPVKFESDISPLKRVLMDNYYDRPTPRVNYAFIDIEVDYRAKVFEPQDRLTARVNGVEVQMTVAEARTASNNSPDWPFKTLEVLDEVSERWVAFENSCYIYAGMSGFSSPTNPYAPINAITVYQSWTGEYLTYAVPPRNLPATAEQLQASCQRKLEELIASGDLPANTKTNIVICSDEYQLLSRMIDDLRDADIVSGWNSEFFDIPYICERLVKIGGQRMLLKLEHAGVPFAPKKEMMNRYGSEEPIYKFSGKCFLDYMRLFQKFTFEGRTSYSLGNILQEEIGLGKLDYNGTLEQLYNRDFETFVVYNFRDVQGLVQLDQKFKFIALANQMAHENTVAFEAVLGTVSYVETGITNHAHYKLNRIVHDKVISEHDKVEGAIVMTPKVGLHEWVGSVDINSLYPNTIRSLNISPEKIIGQFESKEDAWRAIRNSTNERLCLTLESGHQEIATASEFSQLLKDARWAVSAHGTVFDQSDGRGVVPDMLGYWYSERKRLQAEKKKYAALAKAEQDPQKQAEYYKLEEQYDLLQLTKKISMNSLYGSLLNVAFRYGDERMGASVTATGRQITTHMIESIGEILTGERHPIIKRSTVAEDGTVSHEYTSESPACIYGDTDSNYFKCIGATNEEEAVAIADYTAEQVNDSFPQFMREAFNCQPEFDCFIKAGREIVASRGLFQAKKKYMLKVFDLEGVRVNKLKSMGSEIKKADTPKIIQKFLKDTVDMILDGRPYDEIASFVNTSRRQVLRGAERDNIFKLGVAKQVNNLDKFMAEYNNPGTHRSSNGGRLTIPGHVRAACNYNFLLNIFDRGAKTVRSGDKVLVFYLKPNQYKLESIALPAEMSKFPSWFAENFSVDITKTEDKMFDSKLDGIFSALGREVPSPQSVLTGSILKF